MINKRFKNKRTNEVRTRINFLDICDYEEHGLDEEKHYFIVEGSRIKPRHFENIADAEKVYFEELKNGIVIITEKITRIINE